MRLHFGMIRDKEAIYSGLVESQAANQQLAICYNSKGKLLVKICTVAAITREKDAVWVTFHTHSDDGTPENMVVVLDDIESIYPINAFPK